MMVGALVSKVFPKGTVHTVNGTSTPDLVVINFHGQHITALELTSALSLGVGLAQIVMAVCRLSFLTEYISDALISGFTAGSAVHVFMSQIPKAMGVKTPERDGPGMIFYMIYDDFLAAPKTNFWALGISILGIAFLLFGKDYVNPWVKRRFRVPLPLGLFLVIVGTILSKLLNLKEDYHVKVVDHVPQGFPSPSIPEVRLLRYIWTDVLALAIICFMFPFTMGKIFAKKHKYKVDANQAFLAITSWIGSFILKELYALGHGCT